MTHYKSDFCAVVYGEDFGVCFCAPELGSSTAAYYRRYYKKVKVFREEAAYDATLKAYYQEQEEQRYQQARQQAYQILGGFS